MAPFVMLVDIEELAPAVRRCRLRDEAGWLTHAQVFDALQRVDAAADSFSAMILAPGFDAVFWEMPALNRDCVAREFECVVVDGTALAGARPNPHPFRACFRSGQAVAGFENLGGDAFLVAPAPAGDADYAHLAAFLRNAPQTLQREFWSTLAAAVISRLDVKPLWVSTSGLGVAWLHARLDRQPKYYTYAPYRRWPVGR